MYKKSRWELFKDLGVTLFHWILVVLISMFSYDVQYIGLKEVGEVQDTFLFATQFYEVNVPMFILGIALFVIGFHFIWQKFLKKDWIKFNFQGTGWKVAYVIIAIIAIFAIFVGGIFVLFFHMGLTGELTFNAGFVFPIYIVGYIFVSSFIKGNKKKM